MGIEPTNPPNTLSPEAVAAIRSAHSGGGYSGAGSTNYSQFGGLGDVEPYDLTRQSFDNPEFLWPKNSYMDITGREQVIQRGYMRSLLTDPRFPTASAIPAKNRRLFFQFNPQVLQRSVQQTPGAMNPLLQDPAQLAQPIPGTASFGFELLFNREHEVNAGYNDSESEWFKLPNGRDALVAEVGVLADLLVLDTITGQGLSADIIEAVAARSNKADQRLQQEYLDQKVKAKKSKDFNEFEFDRVYKPTGALDVDAISEIYNKNLGNSAFLNALPFRVLFSSLFMVEGIATSIDVVFQKFSKTMVPTQCKVTINMYALYIGFAKKNTFLYDNLSQAAESSTAQITKDEVVERYLKNAFKSIEIKQIWFRGGEFGDNNANKAKVLLKFEKDPIFTEILKNKIVKDVRVKVIGQYYFSSSPTFKPSYEELAGATVAYTLDGVTDIPLDKLLKINPSKIDQYLESEELGNLLKEKQDTLDTYINFRLVVEIIGKGATDVDVMGTSMSFNPIYGAPNNSSTYENIVWTNPFKWPAR